MHVLLATDGSQQSLEAARFLGRLVNPFVIEKITVIAVIRPLARTALGPGPALLPAAVTGDGGVGALNAPKTVAELEGQVGPPPEPKRDPGRIPGLTKRIADKAEKEPEHVAQLVRAMILQDEK